MPFCPECRYEYVAGTKECPDCNLKRVRELQHNESRIDKSPLVPLFEPEDDNEATAIELALKAAGIPVFSQKNDIRPSFSHRLTIYILEDKLDEANKVLAQMEHKDEKHELDLQLLVTVNSILEAQTIADYLKANEIPCVIRSEGLMAYMGGVGPASIYVRQDHLERAQQITGCRLNP